jgi:hypothetical protein
VLSFDWDDIATRTRAIYGELAPDRGPHEPGRDDRPAEGSHELPEESRHDRREERSRERRGEGVKRA